MEPNDRPAKKPFYKTWWGILFLLPISLSILIWKSERLGNNAKIALIVLLWFFVFIIGSSDTSNNPASSINEGMQDAKQKLEKDETEKETTKPDAVIEDQIEVQDSTNTDQAMPSVENEKQAEPNQSETVSQKNAVRKAKSYLEYSAFSRDGLIKQLEFEKYSYDDAVYGADNSGADWSEQAAKKAESYMDYSAYSRGGLIDQLLFEGFTQSQAEYGASAVGL